MSRIKNWGGGYVTDVAYVSSFHPTQSQCIAAVAAISGGYHARLVKRDEAFTLADIGCGAGITAIITAAANPAWDVTGLDFNPAHIETARELAAAAGIGNVRFIEADLREFAGSEAARALPESDAVTMHGVWSWVAPEVQNGILNLLKTRLKPGGTLFVSYDLFTGWQAEIGLQRLVREAGLLLAGRSDLQVEAGLEVARALAKAPGRVSFAPGGKSRFLDESAKMPPAYLAHELMHEHWRPVMHGDVARRLAEAELDYAGSTQLINNIPELALSPEQSEVLRRFDDPLMTELFKDICFPRHLRSDIFIRGARELAPEARDAALREVTLGLKIPASQWNYEFDAAAGRSTMLKRFYEPIVERLARGPATLRQLLELPALQDNTDSPAALIAVTVGTGQAIILPNPGAAADACCLALNRELLLRQKDVDFGALVPIALPACGSGIHVTALMRRVLDVIAADPSLRDPPQIARLVAGSGPPGQLDKRVVEISAILAFDAPLMRHLGLLV